MGSIWFRDCLALSITHALLGMIQPQALESLNQTLYLTIMWSQGCGRKFYYIYCKVHQLTPLVCSLLIIVTINCIILKKSDQSCRLLLHCRLSKINIDPIPGNQSFNMILNTSLSEAYNAALHAVVNTINSSSYTYLPVLGMFMINDEYLDYSCWR